MMKTEVRYILQKIYSEVENYFINISHERKKEREVV